MTPYDNRTANYTGSKNRRGECTLTAAWIETKSAKTRDPRHDSGFSAIGPDNISQTKHMKQTMHARSIMDRLTEQRNEMDEIPP